MRTYWFRVLAGLFAVTMAFAAPASAEKRVALVIGNNDYRNVPPLQKAVNSSNSALL